MTLGDGKRKVLMLLDEYSAGGEITLDEDIENKMADFFDMAQKDICAMSPVIKDTEVTITGGTISQGFRLLNLPADFKAFYQIWNDGRIVRNFRTRGDKMCVPERMAGSLLIEYVAYPADITSETDDSYEFEVAEDASNAMCFYVASQHLITDLVVDYSALWAMYIQAKANIEPAGGTVSVRQGLFS